MRERDVAFLGLLIDQNRMALGERAAARILSGQTHSVTFERECAERQRLAGSPVEVFAGLKHLGLRLKNAFQAGMNMERIGRRHQRLADLLQNIDRHRRVAATVVA